MTQTLALNEEMPEHTTLWQDVWRRMRRNRLALVGMIVLVLVLALAFIGPMLSPYDFLSQDMAARNHVPSAAHWLGTDDLGRDILTRIMAGARTALLVAVVVTAIALVIGVTLGALAGYTGGRVDGAVMWLADVTMSIPSLLLVIVINTSMKPPITRLLDSLYLQTMNPIFRDARWVDFVLIFGSMALISWPPYARLVRAQVLAIRQQPYVRAAKSLGLPTSAILRRYIVPNATGPVIVAVSAGLGNAMVLESAFSFLGIGVNPPTPSWGNMISDGLRVWKNYPHLLAAPALVLGVTTIAFAFIGDGLNDALNPRRGK